MSKLRYNRGTASTKSNATNIFKALTLIFTFGLCFLSPKGISAADDVTTQSSQTIQYEISAEDEAMLQSLGITPEALLQDPNLVNKIQSAIQYELEDKLGLGDNNDFGPQNASSEVTIEISLQKCSRCWFGFKFVLTIKTKTSLVNATQEVIPTGIVTPGKEGEDWIEIPNDKLDIRWEAITFETLPYPPIRPSTGPTIDTAAIPWIALIVPVYEDDTEIGFIVDADHAELYPDAIAYFTMEVGEPTIEITDSTGLKDHINQSFIEVLMSYKDNNSFRVLSKTGAQTTLEFDNKEGANLKFNVYDLQGTVVKTINSMNENITIDGLPSGTYFIECTTDNTLRTKIVIAQ